MAMYDINTLLVLVVELLESVIAVSLVGLFTLKPIKSNRVLPYRAVIVDGVKYKN
jgi:hypothetical protein